MSNFIKLLAIDTSTDACSVAISIDNKIKEKYQLAPRLHSRLLLPMIDSLLKETGITLFELDAFAFGRGPGSFTGVRIAGSVVQALGFAMNKPIVPVSTLRALAQGAYRERKIEKIFANLDARMEEVYWGLFEIDKEGIMQAVGDEHVQSIIQAKSPDDSWQPVTGYPHAQDIAKIALAEYELGHTVSAIDALPVYIRDEVAKKP